MPATQKPPPLSSSKPAPRSSSISNNKPSNSSTGEQSSSTKDAAALAAQQQPANNNNNKDTDKLKRAWRSLASSVVVSTRAAEKAAIKKNQDTKELDDAVMTLLRARSDFRRYVTTIEANLLGQAEENEALEGLLRSQPCMGRKRKRGGGDGDDEKEPSAAVAVAASGVAIPN